MRTDMSIRVTGTFRLWHCLVLLLTIAMWGAAVPPALAQRPVPATLVQAATPMLPYLDWLIDPSGRLTVEDMVAPAQQAAFRPLNIDNIPRESGTVWLRFTLAPRVVDARPSTYLLDMGEGVPGTPTLYLPKHNVLTNTTSWQDFTPSQRSIFLMPDAQTSPVTAYIKMAGMPGLWFAPMLRTPHNAATALERLLRPAVIVVLGVVMLLCLLRGLAERGEWRFWTSLYTGAALLHSVWGVPTLLQGAVPMQEIAAVLAPGVALMLLPHVGRHLMRTREKARVIDAQYLLLALPGAALALLPLIPGFSWTIRYLDLWPLGTLLLVPTTLGAWLMGLAGARRFLLGCLLPPLATALGLMGIGSSFPAPLLATAPLWGVALSALIIAGTAVAYDPAESEARQQDDPLLDPALRIVSPEELAQEASAPLPEPTIWEKGAPPRMPSDSVALAWEERLRGPLDTLQREGSALGTCSLPPVARQHAKTLQDTVRSMLSLLSQPLDGQNAPDGSETADNSCFDLQQLLRDAHDSVATSAENKNIALSWFMPPHLPNHFMGDGRRLAQCIRLLMESAVRATSRGGVQVAVRRVPESVDAGHLLFAVTDTGSGMPPHDRSSMAVARAWELAAANRGFLGVECSPHGTSVSFTVRLLVASAATTATNETQASTPPLTMDDTSIMAPMDMGTDALWQPMDGNDSDPMSTPLPEMAASPQGEDMPMPTAVSESTPMASMGQKNANVRVDSAAAKTAPSTLPRIIIADDSLSNRQLLAFFLEGLPYSTVEARSPDEAAELYLSSPAALIIFDGDMPEEDTLSAVTRIREFEAQYSLPAALILALTTDDSRWEVLHYGGFTHALVKPVSRTGLRRTVQELLPEGTVVVPPVPVGSGLAAHVDTTSTSAAPDIDPAEAAPAAPAKDDLNGSISWLEDGLGNSAPMGTIADDEIIDTGEPLPEPEPLRMSPAETPAKQTKQEGIPLPVMDKAPQAPAMVQDTANMQAKQVMPELAPISAKDAAKADKAEASAAAMDSVPPSGTVAQASDRAGSAQEAVRIVAPIAEEAEADVEDVYPHPSHQGAAAGAGAGQPSLHTVASLDSPQYAHPQTTSAAPAAEAEDSPTAKTTRTIHVLPQEAAEITVKKASSAENLEWVGEPMPVGSIPSVQTSASTPKAKVSAIPAWMRDSVAPRDTATFRAPSGASEWVGDPMPIPKAAPAKVELKPASDNSAVQSSVNDSVPHAPKAKPESEKTIKASASLDSPAAAPTVNMARVNDLPDLNLDDSPARIEDLLTPFSPSSLTAAEPAPTDAVPPAPQQPQGEQSPSFIPLSFDPAPIPAPFAAPTQAVKAVDPAPPVTTTRILVAGPTPAMPEPTALEKESEAPAAPAVSKDAHAPKTERLSLIPESSLMDFIISDQPSAPTPVTAPASAPTGAAKAPEASPPPPHKTITITAGSARPAKVASTTLVLKPANAAPKEVVSSGSIAAGHNSHAPQITVSSPANAATASGGIATPPPNAPTVTARAATPQPVTPNGPSSASPSNSGSTAPSAPSTVTPPASPASSASHDSPIPTMLKEFDEAMAYARGGFARKNIQAVQESAEYIAKRSETCGLRVLARMARCVGEAAKANDVEALNNLLPELETAVERNKIALMKK